MCHRGFDHKIFTLRDFTTYIAFRSCRDHAEKVIVIISNETNNVHVYRIYKKFNVIYVFIFLCFHNIKYTGNSERGRPF